MRHKICVLANTLSIVPIVLFTNIMAVQAQNSQDFVMSEENKIRQSSAAGLLDKRQTSNLQNKEAQLMFQEQQARNQNGGHLTEQQRQVINQETRNLDQNLESEVHKNSPNAVLQPLSQWPNGAGRQWEHNNKWDSTNNVNNANYRPLPQNWQNNSGNQYPYGSNLNYDKERKNWQDNQQTNWNSANSDRERQNWQSHHADQGTNNNNPNLQQTSQNWQNNSANQPPNSNADHPHRHHRHWNPNNNNSQ